MSHNSFLNNLNVNRYHINKNAFKIYSCDMCETYGKCLVLQIYNKRHTAINPPQNTPPHLEDMYPIFLSLSEAVMESSHSWVTLARL